MADVVNLTMAFDKPLYNPGDAVNLTVSGTVNGQQVVAVTATVLVSDQSTATVPGSFNVAGALDYSLSAVTDAGNRTWTLNGKTASTTA